MWILNRLKILSASNIGLFLILDPSREDSSIHRRGLALKVEALLSWALMCFESSILFFYVPKHHLIKFIIN